MVADALVGRLRARLAAAGLYDRALIVITADHGVSFRPGERLRRFSRNTAAEIASVPFIVKVPAAADGPAPGAVDDTNVETIDVLPTVAHVLGVSVPWRVDGRTLVGRAAPRPDKQFSFNSAAAKARLTVEEIASARDALVRRQSDVFGDDSWPAFTLPELRPLVGREVASLGPVPPANDVEIIVERREAFATINLGSPELPAQLFGRFAGADASAASHLLLAVALNGRIVATTRAWPGGLRWAAMLPPDRFRSGANDIDVFVVDPARPSEIRRPRQ